MAQPDLPPYLGSWQELVNALLHNPSLGGGGGGHPPHLLEALRTAGPHPDPWRAGPSPDPWRERSAALLASLSLKEVARRMPEGAARRQFEAGIERAIADEVDDLCPPYRRWPWPGPPPWVQEVISELTAVAAVLANRELAGEATAVAATIAERAFSARQQEG